MNLRARLKGAYMHADPHHATVDGNGKDVFFIRTVLSPAENFADACDYVLAFRCSYFTVSSLAPMYGNGMLLSE